MTTTEENEAVTQLKNRLKDLKLENNGLLEERRLINWLRARDFKVEETEAMFRKHVEWRQENKIDTILTNNPLPMEDPMIANIAADIIGTDKEGNTILAVFSAQMEMKRIVQTYGKGVSMQIVYYFLEMAYADIVARSTDMSNFRSAVYIVDLDSFKFKEFMSADVLDVIISSLKVVEANYPELLSKAYVLNAPYIFPVLWNLLTPFASRKTLEKVHVLGQNIDQIRSCLLEQIPCNQIPRKWGGTGYSQRIPILNVACSAGSGSSSKTDLRGLKDLTEVVIPAGELLELTFAVEVPKVLLSWTFKTKYYDIGFSIVHRPFENDDVAAPKETIKVEYKRLNSQKSVQSGSLICDASGHYILRFDNTYSRLREKKLIHHVEISQLGMSSSISEDKIKRK